MRDDAVLGRALPLDRGLGPNDDMWNRFKTAPERYRRHPHAI